MTFIHIAFAMVVSFWLGTTVGTWIDEESIWGLPLVIYLFLTIVVIVQIIFTGLGITL